MILGITNKNQLFASFALLFIIAFSIIFDLRTRKGKFETIYS